MLYLMLTYLHSCLFQDKSGNILIGAYWCLLVLIGAYWCLLVLIGAYWCLLVLIGAYTQNP